MSRVERYESELTPVGARRADAKEQASEITRKADAWVRDHGDEAMRRHEEKLAEEKARADTATQGPPRPEEWTQPLAYSRQDTSTTPAEELQTSNFAGPLAPEWSKSLAYSKDQAPAMVQNESGLRRTPRASATGVRGGDRVEGEAKKEKISEALPKLRYSKD